MKRILFGTALVLLCGASTLRADDKTDAATANAKAILDAFVKEDYEAAGKNFSDELKKALPPDKLKQVWKGLLEQAGAFKKVHSTNVVENGRALVVTVTCEFEKGALDMDVALDGKNVLGLFFRPNAKLMYKPPTYVKEDAFREVEVKVNAGGEWELPATLTLPRGDGPFPAVVLVHGSGPHDRDETIGPNLPFRDLAGGLATKGIAVLRYEKRTQVYGPKLVKQNTTVTLKEETIDDAVAAAALLRTRKEIDPKQIYVLGHSLGGNAAPWIGQEDDKLAGLILLAGNTRPLTELLIEQMEYLLSLSEKPTDEEKKQIESIKKLVARINDPKLEETALPEERILGASVAYWLALRKYDAAATAKKLKMPLLILQGERDYQVTMKDFEGWKKALKENDNVRFKTYPKLNHLFMEGEGKSQPKEYGVASHVSGAAIDDIVEWIKKH